MNLQPLGDRVVVKPLSEEDMKTPSGIYIPDTAKEKPQEGEVVAVGPGEPNDKGEKTGRSRAPGPWSTSRGRSGVARGDRATRDSSGCVR